MPLYRLPLIGAMVEGTWPPYAVPLAYGAHRAEKLGLQVRPIADLQAGIEIPLSEVLPPDSTPDKATSIVGLNTLSLAFPLQHPATPESTFVFEIQANPSDVIQAWSSKIERWVTYRLDVHVDHTTPILKSHPDMEFLRLKDGSHVELEINARLKIDPRRWSMSSDFIVRTKSMFSTIAPSQDQLLKLESLIQHTCILGYTVNCMYESIQT